MNLLRGKMEAASESQTFRIEGLEEIRGWTVPLGVPAAVEVGFRPEDVAIVGPSQDSPGMPATIRRLEPLGHETLAYLDLGPHCLAARLPARQPFRAGDGVAVDLDFGRACWFDATTGVRIELETGGRPLADGGGSVP
jgi:ABC-type sugar transport system ATPase subunit